MAETALFPGAFAELDGALARADAEIAAHQAARANALGRMEQARQAAEAAVAARADAAGRRDRVAAETAALADAAAQATVAAAAARGARDRAAEAVAAHDLIRPRPEDFRGEDPRPPPGWLAAYREALAEWGEGRALLVQAHQDAINAVTPAERAEAESAARLAQSRAALGAVTSEVDAATAALASAQAERETAAAAVTAADATLTALTIERGNLTKRRLHYERLVDAITAEPLDRTALEPVADELARSLWRLRRERAGLLADEQANRATLATTEQQRAEAWAEFEALRGELGGEFAALGPADCAARLAQRVGEAQARVATAAQRLDDVARRIAEHGEG